VATTITDSYRTLQQELHQNPNYGVASLAFSPLVARLINEAGVKTISDYGAGKQNLLRGLKDLGLQPQQYLPFDPAFPEYGPPRPADLVCCIDVLEHVEPECLTSVLEDLASIITYLGFFTIHMGPAGKLLSDGRNAHLIQKPSSWWLPRIAAHFEVLRLDTHALMGPGLWLVVRPRESGSPADAGEA
jgi:hypothetical protein